MTEICAGALISRLGIWIVDLDCFPSVVVGRGLTSRRRGHWTDLQLFEARTSECAPALRAMIFFLELLELIAYRTAAPQFDFVLDDAKPDKVSTSRVLMASEVPGACRVPSNVAVRDGHGPSTN